MNEERYDLLLVELTLLSMIEPHDKLCIRNGNLALQKKTLWITQAIKRWWYLDSRSVILEKIRALINNSISCRSESQRFNTIFPSVIGGLSNLSKTYEDDAVTVAHLKILIDKLSSV